MDFRVKAIKTLNIDIEEFIKTEQINKDNIAIKVLRYCEQLQKYGYEILPSEWQKLYLEIEKKLNKNT
jgi:hypothetical protein